MSKFLLLIVLLISSFIYISCSENVDEGLYFVEKMTPSDIQKVAQGASIAYVPLGAIEWHNEHLPLGLDSIKSFELCKRICKKTGGVIYPPNYFGTHTVGRKGTFPAPPELVEQVFSNTVDNLINQGFRVIVTLTGHTPKVQMEILKKLAKKAEAENKFIRVISLTEGTFVYDEQIELFGHYQDHAAAGETSTMMYMRPELVHLDRLNYPIKPKEEGILWDPRYGSKENGEKIVKLIVERSSEYILKERQKLFDKYPEAPKKVIDQNQGVSILDEMY